MRKDVAYDDLSNTDRCYTRVEITSEAVINANYLAVMAPDLRGKTDNAAEILTAIETRLMTPRKALSLTLNGVSLLPMQQTGVPGTVDAKNGPQPQYCHITQLTTVTFLIQYKIIAHYWLNPVINPDGTPIVTNKKGNPAVYNRWSETLDLDNCNYSTVTREGKFVIRSDNAQNLTPAGLRDNMAVVQCPVEFLRVSSNYTISPDGLAMTYRFVEKEQFKMPPAPAYEASGDASFITSVNGAILHAEANCRLKGAKNVSQAELLSTAMGVVSQKLKSGGINANGKGVRIGLLDSASIKVWMWENIVEVRYRALMLPLSDQKKFNVWGFDYDKMVETPLSEQKDKPPQPKYLPAPVPSQAGVAPFLLQAAAYFDPSLVNVDIDPIERQMRQGRVPGQAGFNPE